MKAPSSLLLKLSRRLFADIASQESFLAALIDPQPFAPCILWSQPKPAGIPWTVEPSVAWQPDFVDRLSGGAKPGQDPLHDQGYFYCLDFSSVFAALTLLNLPPSNPLTVDVCAAPGGKSLFAWRALQPALLISNEVIGKRMGALLSNLKRCRVAPVALTRLDSKWLANSLPATAQVVIVDAPCSGQSLLAKGGKVPGCFHPVTINKNANRQKRILANSVQLVAPQGYLAYMTCTYSPEENEQVAEWLLERFPQFQPVPVAPLASYQSHLSDLPCYRIWPQQGLGAGAFTILFQNTATGEADPLSADFLAQPGVIRLG